MKVMSKYPQISCALRTGRLTTCSGSGLQSLFASDVEVERV